MALAFHSHIPAQLVATGVSPLRQRLWDSGCWLHAIIALGSARRALHIIVAYGFSGTYSCSSAHSANEQFFSDVFEEASCRSDLPCIILSDMNRQPQDSDVCRQACLRGGWLDAGLAGADLSPTHFPPHGQPRRLDIVLLNKTAAVSFSEYKILDDAGFPNHKPIVVHLSLPSLHLTHTQLRRPRKLPEAALTPASPEAERENFLQSWQRYSADWEAAVKTQDTDALFRCFNRISEDFLCERGKSAISPQPRKHYCGRGSLPRFFNQPATGVSRPTQADGAQTTAKERCLRKLARQLEELSRMLPSGPSVWPTSLLHLWRKASSRAARCDLHFSPDTLRECKIKAIKRADSLSKSQKYEALNLKSSLIFATINATPSSGLIANISAPNFF